MIRLVDIKKETLRRGWGYCLEPLNHLEKLAKSDPELKNKIDLWLSGKKGTVFLRDELIERAVTQSMIDYYADIPLYKDNVFTAIDACSLGVIK